MFIKEGSLIVKEKNTFWDYFVASILILPLLILFFRNQWLLNLIQYFVK